MKNLYNKKFPRKKRKGGLIIEIVEFRFISQWFTMRLIFETLKKGARCRIRFSKIKKIIHSFQNKFHSFFKGWNLERMESRRNIYSTRLLGETDGKFLLRFRNNEFSSTVGEGEAKSWRKLGERAAVKFGKTLGAKVVSLVSREGEGSGITPVV